MLNRLQDVFRSFQRHDVKYVVIGGIATILHGVPRATFDLDILIEATPENAQRLLDALLDAGLGSATLTSAQQLLANEITIFKDRVRIDVQTSTPGIDFAAAWRPAGKWYRTKARSSSFSRSPISWPRSAPLAGRWTWRMSACWSCRSHRMRSQRIRAIENGVRPETKNPDRCPGLALLEVQPEGRKVMPGAAFLCGHPLKIGDRLG